MDKDLALFDVVVYAEQVKELVSLIPECSRDSQANAIIFAMPDEHRKIIESWKRCIRGRFIIERHLKSGSILISMEDEKVYQVGGIIPYNLVIGGNMRKGFKEKYMTVKRNGTLQKLL